MQDTFAFKEIQQTQKESVSAAVDVLEIALIDFKKLSIEAGAMKGLTVPSIVLTSARSTDCQLASRTRKGSRFFRPQQHQCNFRHFPYRVPRSIHFAIWKYRIEQKRKALSELSSKDSTQIHSLHKIQLNGCDFRGQTLSTCTREEGTNARRAKDSLKIPSTSNDYRIKSTRPKPCWLQHLDGSDDAQIATSQISDRYEQDEGVNELSDYFEHFVCLCAPKMPEWANAIYS